MKADLELQEVYNSIKKSKGVEAALMEVKERLLFTAREDGKDSCSVGLGDGNRVAVSRTDRNNWDIHIQYGVTDA